MDPAYGATTCAGGQDAGPRPPWHNAGMRADGRAIAEPEFPDDDGSAAPDLAAALSAYDADPEAGHRPALAALQDSRLLVPVVATLGEVEYDDQGLAHDKSSDMAAVL